MSVISRTKLTEKQRWTLLNGLNTAKETYENEARKLDAFATVDLSALASTLRTQAAEAQAMYELIENAETIALEDC